MRLAGRVRPVARVRRPCRRGRPPAAAVRRPRGQPQPAVQPGPGDAPVFRRRAPGAQTSLHPRRRFQDVCYPASAQPALLLVLEAHWVRLPAGGAEPQRPEQGGGRLPVEWQALQGVPLEHPRAGAHRQIPPDGGTQAAAQGRQQPTPHRGAHAHDAPARGHAALLLRAHAQKVVLAQGFRRKRKRQAPFGVRFGKEQKS